MNVRTDTLCLREPPALRRDGELAATCAAARVRAQCSALSSRFFALPWSTARTPRSALILLRHACTAQLKSAAGSYCKIPPCPLLAAYLDDDAQRAFVDSMAEVSVPKHEVIMRQGALPSQPAGVPRACACAVVRACVRAELAGGCSRVAPAPALRGWAHCTPRRRCRCRHAAGDKGNNYYVIKEGTAEVMLTDASGETKHVRTLSAGNSCGELSLLTGSPRSATVQATSSTLVLLMVNRRMFNATIGDAIIRKRARWKDFIRDLPAIGPPPPHTPCLPPARSTQHAARSPRVPSATRGTRLGAEAAVRAAPDTHPLPR